MLYDKDIRLPLFDFLEDNYGDVRILEEKQMGRSRADIVMVGRDNNIYGVEIKSDADTYARLSRQVKDYDKYFDYNIVVVGTSHAYHIEEHVPEYWGIITVELEEGAVDFYMLRHAKPNPKMKWKSKITLMWRPELAKIQKWNNMPKYKDKSKAFVQGKILERMPDTIPEEVLKKQMCELLFCRDYDTIGDEIKDFKSKSKWKNTM